MLKYTLFCFWYWCMLSLYRWVMSTGACVHACVCVSVRQILVSHDVSPVVLVVVFLTSTTVLLLVAMGYRIQAVLNSTFTYITCTLICCICVCRTCYSVQVSTETLHLTVICQYHFSDLVFFTMCSGQGVCLVVSWCVCKRCLLCALWE